MVICVNMKWHFATLPIKKKRWHTVAHWDSTEPPDMSHKKISEPQLSFIYFKIQPLARVP